MTEPIENYIDVSGYKCRVWSKGKGDRIGFLPGFGGLPKWIPFLDILAEDYEVVVPSIPGFPGGLGHNNYDNHLEWLLAIHDLLQESKLLDKTTIIGSGPGASLCADIAALWPSLIKKLCLISPWGIYSDNEPMADPWAQRAHEVSELMCDNPELWNNLKSDPAGKNSVEWPIEQSRALEASARIFWPLGNTGLDKRLRRVCCPVLLLRGVNDKVIPKSYMKTFSKNISGQTTTKEINQAGHLAELDQPDIVAKEIMSFVSL